MPCCKKNENGFTLIEMLITVSILGIILAIAIPNFTDWLNRNRVVGAANEYSALIQFARSESIKRNANIYLQATRTDDSTWSLMASTQKATCTSLSACDLRNMLSANYRAIKVKSITNAAATANNLHQTKINPIDPIFQFSDATTDTTMQYVTFESDIYQLNTQIIVTGLTTICVPTGKPSISGYSTCS